ncbi:MAG: T9SS type A sorting domain-containing protein [Sphingobacteriales bacterium]|nr:MAG: T9SS type A sorting domain-containing protein [Sphingobacteriales bacterium]
MKRIFILLAVALLMCLHYTMFAQAQVRYFQFTTECGHGNWQDTAYVAGTSDTALIRRVLAELDKPKGQRQFVAGKIGGGHGWHNCNAGHWFKWHFVTNEWNLVDMAMEVCDGCPYSDIDADTAYWLNNVGIYCGWGGQPTKELIIPTAIEDKAPLQLALDMFPNPATNVVTINKSTDAPAVVTICNALGQGVLNEEMNGRSMTLNVSSLPVGCYLLKLQLDGIATVKQLVIHR